MDILDQVVNDVKDRARRIADRISAPRSSELAEKDKQEKLLAKVKSMQALLKDERYVDFQDIVNGLQVRLEENLRTVLVKDFANYSRIARADKAAIIAAQLEILRVLINEPNKVIELMKEVKL